MSEIGKFIKSELYISVGNILGAAIILVASANILQLIFNPYVLDIGVIFLPLYVLFDICIAIIVILLFLRRPPGYEVLGFLAILIIPLLGAGLTFNSLSGLFGDDFVHSNLGVSIVAAGIVLPFTSYLVDYVRRRHQQPSERDISAESKNEVRSRLSKLEKQ